MSYITRMRAALGSAALVVALAGTLLSAAPANAAEAEADHCLAAVSEPTTLTCFPTFDQAKAYFLAMGGQVYAPKDPSSGLAPGNRAGSAALIPIPTLLYIGYDWTNQNPLGGSIWYFGLSGGCTKTIADVDYQVSPLPATWINRITSTQLFSNCWANHYINTGYGGSSTGYQGSMNSLSVTLNNNASSIRWS